MAKKKATRCIRKTKDGKRCKRKARAGLKSCPSHATKRKRPKSAGPKKRRAKKKVRRNAKKRRPKKKVAKKVAKKVKKKRSPRRAIRAKSGVRRTQARCRMLLTTGKRCRCYCEPGGVYCLTHRKKAKSVSKAKIRKNPNPASINMPWRG